MGWSGRSFLGPLESQDGGLRRHHQLAARLNLCEADMIFSV
jgi:hypothetical protein